MLFKIKLLIIQVFAALGFNLSKLSALKPFAIEDPSRVNPRYISYFLKTGNGVVISASMDRARAFPINSFGKDGNHPFMVAARSSLGEDGQISSETMAEVLEVYYRSVVPTDAAHLLGLSPESKLSKYPAWAAVMPWDAETIDEWKETVAVAELLNNYRHKCDLTIENGWAWVGPVDDEKRLLEVKRLCSLLSSVREKGYQRNDGPDGDIKTVLLVNENEEWVWQSVDAQHRAAVVSAIGLEETPIRVYRVIRREDVEFWPNVVCGLYSIDEALLVFDNIFHGRFSHITEKWDVWLKEFQSKGLSHGE